MAIKFPEQWAKTSLGRIAQIEMGQSPKGTATNTEGIGTPLVGGAADLGDEVPISKRFTTAPTKVCEPDDIILCIRATIGKHNTADKRYCLGRGVAGLRPIGVQHCWLKNWLSRNSNNLEKLGTGTTFKQINKTVLNDFPVQVPPIQEQQRISDKIESLQSKSQKAKQALDAAKPLLDKLRQSILASAFRGDLTAEWRKKNPDVEPANHLLGKIQNERCEAKARANTRYSFKITSEIDERFINTVIPSTWVKTNIDSVSIYIVDCAHSTPKWTTSGKMCLRTTNFSPFKLNLDEVRYVSEKTYQNRIERLKPKVGDILYSREGGILGIACLLDIEEDICLGQRMMLFRPSCSVSSQFFSYYLNSPIVLKHVSNLIGGSASPHINIRDIKKFPFPLPPIEEQQEIARRIELFFNFIDDVETNYLNATVKLNKLAQAILSKAFKGELVPQDPSDEPAAELLARINGQGPA
ncbi:restriction endonuclease subunit S [uncultured Desulfobacter sp.]|uniref:restriction endonuclease subunit S n=1 Tax=uncultured Desulfobacter sp. TaxID=240139 RepID=UPI0029F49D84|nr:restriction endonuclease subunit S [uncultured Desulfobacter sp.]